MTIQVGEVIVVRGITITLKIFEESNKDVIYYKSDKLKGISIREHVLIKRGFIDIICIVEGEYLDESRIETEGNKVIYIRKVDVKPIGHMVNEEFNNGIKYLPMIKDPVYLLSEKQIAKIFTNYSATEEFKIGYLLKEEIPISLPWNKLFNTHLGIFGNTGSGKSNTLTKLYTELFNAKKDLIKNKSKFVIIDFNGEYTNDQLIDKNYKKVLNLSTKSPVDKFGVTFKQISDPEMLALLFQATINTQKPFIKRVVDGWSKYMNNANSLSSYLKSTIKKMFTTTNQKKETLDLIRTVLKFDENNQHIKDILQAINNCSWHSKNSCFQINSNYFNGGENCQTYGATLTKHVNLITLSTYLPFFDELIIRVNLKLINDLLNGYVQFEHIQPLLKRIESFSVDLSNIIKLNDNKESAENIILEVISLRNCNQDVKKIMPLIIAKYYYNNHKEKNNTNPPNNTLHLIVDEAHNILSQQSTREHETWKDYRLEIFEEIIKEGRKFGFFLTVCSQRPADISPTIMSQIHNFFIHRLVNDKDLNLLNNTISTLDALSRSMIPNLSKGACIVTGTSFDIPLVMQIDILPRNKQPDSEDINLTELWSETPYVKKLEKSHDTEH